MIAIEQQTGNLLTIGELSRRTGIGTHTLRMWEKRYDAPRSIRLPSGHRRYLPEEVDRLRAVGKALQLGYRAGKVAGGTQDELSQLLGLDASGSSRVSPPIPGDDDASIILNQWVDCISRFDEETLSIEMHRQWGQRGPLDFVARLAAPLVIRIGTEWECGNFSVAQEHFATDILSNFLSDRWRRQNERKHGPTAILATLSGESHILGLQMVAAVMSVTDWKIVSLGLDVPEEEIVHTVERCGAPLLCLSVSEWYGVSQAKPILYRLRKSLKRKTDILAGGGGAPFDLQGVEQITDFNNFYHRLTNQRNR